MKKLKMYLYPNRKPVCCDLSPLPGYKNCTPFSQKGMEDWVESVSPWNAEFFYMGEINPSMPTIEQKNWEFWNEYKRFHIADLEGDYNNTTIREDLKDSIVTSSCIPIHWKNRYAMGRPALSKFLVYIVRHMHEEFSIPNSISFGFKGEMDVKGNTRVKTYKALRLAKLQANYQFNPGWSGRVNVDQAICKQYQDVMINNLIAVCPQGAGIGTIRRFEACYFTRVPVVIGECLYTGYDYYDTSFAYQLPSTLTQTELANELTKIAETPISELQDRAKAARVYFDTVVRNYFKDPTLFFLNYLERHNLWNP